MIRHSTRRLLTAAAACVATAVLVAGCAEDAPASDADATTASSTPSASADASPQLAGDVTVYAAASLTETFTQMGEDFEAAHPGVTITFSFAGSSDLATQIVEGAPADVFASANQSQMDVIDDASLTASTPVTFATNVLTIVTPLDNPAGVDSFDDLASADVTTVVCAPQVPCGAATVTLEEAFGVDIPAVSEESSVTDVLGKVSNGQADAGLVYVTDATTAGDTVLAVPIDGTEAATNTYPIASVAGSSVPDAAAAFVDYVTGTQGQAILAAAGFGAP